MTKRTPQGASHLHGAAAGFPRKEGRDVELWSGDAQGGVQRPFENVRLESFSINGKSADWSAFNFTTNTPVILREFDSKRSSAEVFIAGTKPKPMRKADQP